MVDTQRAKATVYVGGLGNHVNSRTLLDAFIPFGDIVDVTLPKPDLLSSPDPHRGFGYVEFELVQDAQDAIDNMDQSQLFGRVIKVAQAKPQKDATQGLGSKTAVWEQDGWVERNAAKDEDVIDTQRALNHSGDIRMDPKEGLAGLDVAGPRPAEN